MSQDSAPKLAVIADDVTGAMDTGVQFARAGWATALLLSLQTEVHATVAVISTHSRDVDPARAEVNAAAAARQLDGRRLFKKIDSTMRGHVGLEIEAIRSTAGLTKAVVCPAAIELGRRVIAGQLWVGDRLLHDSDFALDPTWPARVSDIASLLGRPASHVSLSAVRRGAEYLVEAIQDSPLPIVSVDAEILEDLAIIGQAAATLPCLPCGSLGLARLWLLALVGGVASAQPTPTLTGPLLVVAGSVHPRTTAQIEHVMATHPFRLLECPTASPADCRRAAAIELAAGRSVIVRTPRSALGHGVECRDLSSQLAGLVRAICQESPPGGLLLTGGATALAVFEALDTEAVQIKGELLPGIPWGRLDGGLGAGWPVVTKAGGFGETDALLIIAQLLSVRR